MNLHDLKTFLTAGMVNCIEASPALVGEEKALVYQVSVFLKMPEKHLNLELPYTTDRPFTETREIYEFFTSAGVPKHKILLVYPKGSDNYKQLNVQFLEPADRFDFAQGGAK